VIKAKDYLNQVYGELGASVDRRQIVRLDQTEKCEEKDLECVQRVQQPRLVSSCS